MHPTGQGMLNTSSRAEMAAILVALRECQSDKGECIVTDSKISIQNISKQLRLPHDTEDDCCQTMPEAIVALGGWAALAVLPGFLLY